MSPNECGFVVARPKLPGVPTINNTHREDLRQLGIGHIFPGGSQPNRNGQFGKSFGPSLIRTSAWVLSEGLPAQRTAAGSRPPGSSCRLARLPGSGNTRALRLPTFGSARLIPPPEADCCHDNQSV